MSNAYFLIPPEPQFADLLRSWRKVRKISQWNLSLIAGISQRHLSFLESGRSSPSREMVLLLARSLELPLREQNAMLNAAGFASIYRQSGLDDDQLRQANHALTVMLDHHEPYPAVVVDRNWNLLLSNQANTRVFALFVDPVEIWSELGDAPPNLLRLTLHPNGLKPWITNWDTFAAYFISRLSEELSSNPFNNEARTLLDEVKGYPGVPEADFASRPASPVLPLELEKDDIRLSLFSMISTFGTPQDVTLQELRIETFFPADEHSEKVITGSAAAVA